ncbi:BA14K family protein [Ciceribacter sp. RN22]|uniref:BA14K family protein n=1 Tax=Ciceribacter sp. RN22 TaxID=2954932 RepID=UPI002092E07F|nr:BA14K family protein [Ciceribacter sp. RN22]MCO6178882.1 BA14K family protein [Ciceribacter sp. RN22]
MTKFAKFTLLSAAVATVVVSASSPALAGHRHHRNDAAIIAGVVGLAAGVAAGSALASQPRYVEPDPVYVERPPVYVEPQPAYVDEYPRAPRRTYVTYDLEPWSPQWYRYCSDRYRSFNPRSGTYVGYDGREHFCTAG